MHTVAVIDLGKTNSKVALVDTASAEEIKVITQPASVNSHTIYPSLDHDAIQSFIIDSLRSLSSENTIDAITVTTHGATAALINTDGDLALPVLDYEFDGVDELRADYDRFRPAFSETGSPALPGGLNLGAQLYWQQKKYPQQFATATTLLTWPQYWIHYLTGQKFNDVSSLGCHTDLYQPRNQCYSSLVDSMGWSPLMPPTRTSGELCGTLKTHLAELTGLPATIPVYTGIHDSNASLVPHLVTHKSPFTVVSTGTWFIVMAIGGSATELDAGRDTLLNVSATGQSVPSARFMGGRERELLAIATIPSQPSMDRLITDHSNPVMLMPSVVQGTGPYPKAESRWLGTDTDNETLQSCATTLYMALMTNECMRLIGSEGPTFIEGPLSDDQQYAQMLAAVSEREVMISTAQTGTSIGAAMMISKPEVAPSYIPIKIKPERREQLQRYARLWQKNLHDHAI